MSCAECQSLRDEVVALRRELAYDVDAALAADVKRATGCRPQQAKILALLYQANGRPLRWATISEAIGSCSDEPNVVRVQVNHLRRTIPSGVVETVWGFGFCLSEVGRAWLDSLRVARVAA